MGAFNVIRRVLRSSGTASDQTYSIVVLEKHHHFLRKETLRAAAEQAFGHPFTSGSGPYHVHQSTSTFLQADTETIHITQSSTPHAGHAHEVETRHADHHFHHNAWKEHRGYIAYDLWNKDHNRHDAYRVLAKLVTELLNDNSTGIYLPREDEFYPNDGSAEEHLKHLLK